MGKVLRTLVIIFAILAVTATYFAYVNYNKREILIQRTHNLEDMMIKVASTFEKGEMEEVAQISGPNRDISEVTSREIESPSRSDFWESYENKYEIGSTAPEMFSISNKRMDLRTLYFRDAEGKYVIDQLTGKPQADGQGTMKPVLDSVLERANAQYKRLNDTRKQLPVLRKELESTIEELNALKQEARRDKCTIVARDARIAELEAQVASLEQKVSQKEDEIRELQKKIEDLEAEIAEKDEQIAERDSKITELNKTIDILKGSDGVKGGAIGTTASVADGVLTPGDKGKIVAADDTYKYAVIEFNDEFMTQLIGADREQPLPLIEINVKRPSDTTTFVTRLKLRQAFRNNNLVIADILSSWQQMPVQKGDIVFN